MCFYHRKIEFCGKTFKTLSKHLWRYSKKLQQQLLQEVRNHGNYVKNDFYIENQERSFAGFDD